MELAKIALGAVAIVGGVFLSSMDTVQAAVLDFEGLPSTQWYGTPNPSSVLTDQFKAEGVIFGKEGQSPGVAAMNNSWFDTSPSSGENTIVGLDTSGNIPVAAVADIFFSFVLPGTTTAGVTDFVSFTLGDSGGDLDFFKIRSYDIAGNLIDTLDVSGESRFSVSINLPGIHSIEIDFLGENFGYSVDDLTFSTPTEVEEPSQSVPEPASALTLLGFGVLGASAVKKRQQKSIS